MKQEPPRYVVPIPWWRSKSCGETTSYVMKLCFPGLCVFVVLLGGCVLWEVLTSLRMDYQPKPSGYKRDRGLTRKTWCPQSNHALNQSSTVR